MEGMEGSLLWIILEQYIIWREIEKLYLQA